MAAPRSFLPGLKVWAQRIKTDVHALALAARDRRTPLVAKMVAIAVVAYALSPIDLIPDVIPVLGQLDDLLLVPLGLILAIKLIPAPLMQEFRLRAQSSERLPRSLGGAAFVLGVWILAIITLGWWLARRVF